MHSGRPELIVFVSGGGISSVLVAQLDKASDYESEDWGFKSLQGYLFISVFCLYRAVC